MTTIRLAVLLLSLLAFLGAGCNLTITPPPPPALNPNSVIFSAEQTAANLDIFFPTPESTWTPSESEVAQLEMGLPAFLRTAEDPWLRPDPPIWERAPDYLRQYLGIVEDGEQIIYANFFCSAEDIDWHNEVVFVQDGGDCYFQVKYNPGTGEFFDLMVNGES